MPTFGECFAGIGGLALGLCRAGWEPRWFVEIDPFCQKVLRKHWPEVRQYGDIRQLTGEELEAVDLVAGGWPCQPHSYAGKRLGSRDERDMWPDFIRIIRAVKPRFVLGENVPGVLSSDGGRYFGGVLRDLAESGYDAEWQVLSAAAFGAPHIRERLFIAANTEGEQGRRIRQPPILTNTVRDRIASDTSERSARTLRESREIPPPAGGGRGSICWHDQWKSEPALDRVVPRFPAQLDELEHLGNAVVPQVAEWLGRRIMEAM